MLDCTKTCWPCQVRTISSAKCNAWIRWRATPQTVLRNGVQVCYCDNTRGRWVQTLASKTPIALARTKTPPMTPSTKKKDLQKKIVQHFKYCITNKVLEQINSLWLQTLLAILLNQCVCKNVHISISKTSLTPNRLINTSPLTFLIATYFSPLLSNALKTRVKCELISFLLILSSSRLLIC